MSGSAEILPYNLYQIGENFGMIFMFLSLLWLVRKKVDKVLLFAYGFFILAHYEKLIVMIPPKDMPLDYFAILGGSVFVRPLTILTLFFLLFIFMPKTWVRPLFFVVTGMMTLDLLWLSLGHVQGLLNAYSFDASVAALLLPWLLFDDEENTTVKNALGFTIVLFLMYLGGRTSLLCIPVGLTAIYFHQKKWKHLLGVLIFATIYFFFIRTGFFEPSGRVVAYKTYFRWWKDSVDPLMGLSLGGFRFIGPWIPVNGIRFFIFHNDFLQVLFEAGVVGFTIFCAVALIVVLKAYKHSMMTFTFCAMLFVVMLTYFPSHMFISQFIILLYLKLIFYEDRAPVSLTQTVS